MKRYIHLYFVYIKRAIQARLEYKKDAIIGIASFLVNNACSLFSLMVIIKSISALDGWDMYSLGFLYGMVMLVKSVDHFFTDALWFIGYWYIPRGQLDKHLIRPVNPLFQVIAETIQFEALGETILGLALTIFCGLEINIIWNFEKVLLLIICLTFGAAIITGLKLITSSIALWTKRSGQVMSGVYNFSDYAKYPLSIYNKATPIKYMLLFIIPFGLIMTLPTQYIIFGFCDIFPNVYILIVTICAMSLLFNFIGVKLFNLGLYCYESSGN